MLFVATVRNRTRARAFAWSARVRFTSRRGCERAIRPHLCAALFKRCAKMRSNRPFAAAAVCETHASRVPRARAPNSGVGVVCATRPRASRAVRTPVFGVRVARATRAICEPPRQQTGDSSASLCSVRKRNKDAFKSTACHRSGLRNARVARATRCVQRVGFPSRCGGERAVRPHLCAEFGKCCTHVRSNRPFAAASVCEARVANTT
eukprot:7372493-Lingulodinium_polyedra.AAC.1